MPDTGPSAASGRPSLGLTRDADWEKVVRAVNALPAMAEKRGVDVTVAWAQTELRSLIDLLALAPPRTPASALAQHRVHLLLGEGFVRVYARPDRAGLAARRDLLSAIEREMLHPTFRAVFGRSSEPDRRPYVPVLGT
jgi:hypothetical protein